MGKKRVVDMDAFCFDTEVVDALGYKGSILYIRLWSLAEDFGGYEPNFESIALRMGAFKLKSKEIQVFITKLVKIGKIVEYKVNGKTYHWIKAFFKRQVLNNPALPQNVPLPEWIKAEVGEYKSGKKFAIYSIISELVPVGYQHDTGKSETKRLETETKQKRKETLALSKTVSEKCIQQMKKEFPDDDIPKCLQAFYDWCPNSKNPIKDYNASFRTRMRNQFPNIKKNKGSGGRTHGELDVLDKL